MYRTYTFLSPNNGQIHPDHPNCAPSTAELRESRLRRTFYALDHDRPTSIHFLPNCVSLRASSFWPKIAHARDFVLDAETGSLIVRFGLAGVRVRARSRRRFLCWLSTTEPSTYIQSIIYASSFGGRADRRKIAILVLTARCGPAFLIHRRLSHLLFRWEIEPGSKIEWLAHTTFVQGDHRKPFSTFPS